MATLTVHAGDTVTRLECPASQSVRDALDLTDLRVRAACGGTGSCGACRIRLLSPGAPHTAAEYMKLDAGERAAGVRLACQLRPVADMDIALDDPAPASPWRSIPMENLARHGAGPARHVEGPSFGLAVDLGTTHLRLAFWDRAQGRRIATRLGPNPQSDYGADVLNRLDAALRHADHARAMERRVRDAILDGLRDMLARDVGEVSPMLAKIGRVVVVGNTAMLALLTGHGAAALLAPDNWSRGIDCRPDDMAAWTAGWPLPKAEFVIPAPVAGFVGADLLADCAAIAMDEDPPGTLLLDIGTNTEIALWDGETIHVTSVPGGPAFEGAGIANGMGADPGAIYRVQASGEGLRCHVIGDGEARGLCGSGLVDAVAAMLELGLVKPSGRFADATGGHGHALVAGNPRSRVAGSAVDALQRAKAAVAAAQEELLGLAGMGWSDVRRLVICGAFGRHLGVDSAQRIGLLPSVTPSRIELFADAALAGAEAVLLDAEADMRLDALRMKIKAVNLGMLEGYDERFLDHLRLRPFS